MRLLLAAYQHPRDRPFQLSDAFGISMSESRRKEFASAAGRIDDPEKSPLSEEELLPLRQTVQENLAAKVSPPTVIKTHNAFVKVKGYPIIRAEVTLGAIYVVRNPLDVVDSLADHFGVDHDRAITLMADPRHRIGSPREELVTQYLQTWSGHVRSWLEQPLFPVHLVRYENLQACPLTTLRNVVSFLGWPVDNKRLKEAVEETQFSRLQSAESTLGFKERSKRSRSGSFFRSGQVGAWHKKLTESQIASVVDHHHETMAMLDYDPE